MSWIKRNLYFVAGAGVAVLLLGLAGWYLWSNYGLYQENKTKLEAANEELRHSSNLQPSPGNEKTDNIANAKKFQVGVRERIVQAHKFFVPIPSIPPGENVSARDYSGALRQTIDELTRAAGNASVALPPKYDFSFAAQKPQVRFAAGTLEPLAAQLGEVKAICDVLFKAKINNLYNLRRVRVSEYDIAATQSDYLETMAITNDLAVLVPYEATFFGFSGELAAVLSGFANDRHGFIVTTLNVEPGTPSSMSMEPGMMAPPLGYGAGDRYNPNAYGERPVGAYANPYDRYANPTAPPGAQPGVAGAGRPGATQVMLDERQLKVTMGVLVVKLLPKK